MQNIEVRRSEMADLLKGFAIIFMILVHICELFLNTDYYSLTITKISFLLGGPPAAPIFMIIMGYFLQFSKRNKKEMAYRGLKLILLGFALNIAININLFFYIFNNKITFLNPWEYVFGVDILFLAGISTIILSFIKFSPHPKIIAFTTFVVMLVIINFTGNIDYSFGNFDYLSAYFIRISNWSYFPVIPWFIYPLFGFLLAQYKKVLKYFNPSLIWRAVLISIYFVFIYLTYNYAFDITNNLNLYYNHTAKFFGYTLLFLAGFWLLAKQLNVYFGNYKFVKYFKWLGKNVTLAYVIQWIIIGNISTSVYRTLNIYYSIGAFILITIIVSLFVYYFEDKIKGIKI
ncbi:MAG: heparan-alpha-glucosaminide N-acetyltransferase domain-containing protein [bacterium]